MNIKTPCFNCENRYVGCHSKCAPYMEFRENKTLVNKKKYAVEENLRQVNACLRSRRG